jgi:hypothetical protein
MAGDILVGAATAARAKLNRAMRKLDFIVLDRANAVAMTVND